MFSKYKDAGATGFTFDDEETGILGKLSGGLGNLLDGVMGRDSGIKMAPSSSRPRRPSDAGLAKAKSMDKTYSFGDNDNRPRSWDGGQVHDKQTTTKHSYDEVQDFVKDLKESGDFNYGGRAEGGLVARPTFKSSRKKSDGKGLVSRKR